MSSGKGFDKIVLVTRKTRLDGLVERFNTRAQAAFYIEHSGGDFNTYLAEHEQYQRSQETVRQIIEQEFAALPLQMLERSLVPTYLFDQTDLVVTLGQDGLVANVAKYVGGQPIIAVNPDAARFDGKLLPFGPSQLRPALERTMSGLARLRAVSMAEARLNDGQRLLAFNDLFIGASSHVSARYCLRHKNTVENQSSSGIIVSTGAGSSGWLSSVFNEAAGIISFLGGVPPPPVRMGWEEERLFFVVREPFASLSSQAALVVGAIEGDNRLQVESQMPSGGVIFSDGVEADFLPFNSGTIAGIGLAVEKANLVVA